MVVVVAQMFQNVAIIVVLMGIDMLIVMASVDVIHLAAPVRRVRQPRHVRVVTN